MKNEWHVSEQFLDFLVEEGHLQVHEKEGKDQNRMIEEIRDGETSESRKFYATLYKQNMNEYHRWRQRKGVDD